MLRWKFIRDPESKGTNIFGGIAVPLPRPTVSTQYHADRQAEWTFVAALNCLGPGQGGAQGVPWGVSRPSRGLSATGV